MALPRTAADQEQVGTPVASLAEAEPGDLLFFEPGQNGAPPGEAGHVAIYLGNDEMIAAPETGENVQVQQVPGEPLAIRRAASVPVGRGRYRDHRLRRWSRANFANRADGQRRGAGTVREPHRFGFGDEWHAGSPARRDPLQRIPVRSVCGLDGRGRGNRAVHAEYRVRQWSRSLRSHLGHNRCGKSAFSSYHSAFGSWSDAVAAYASGAGAVEAAGGVPSDGSTSSYVASALALAGMAPSS